MLVQITLALLRLTAINNTIVSVMASSMNNDQMTKQIKMKL